MCCFLAGKQFQCKLGAKISKGVANEALIKEIGKKMHF